MHRLLAALASVAVGVALCVLATALGVWVLVGPWYTRLLVVQLDIPPATGLSAERALEVAEEVRALVAGSRAVTPPEQVDDRSGFDAAAVSHLRDVRDAVRLAYVAAVALAVALAVWLAVSLRRKRHRAVAAGLRAGAVLCLLAPALLALLGATDFEWLFTEFHGVFFAPGTWTFPYDSLLILLFPERFWVTAGASLAGLVVAQGVALWAASALFGRRSRSVAE